MKLYRAAGTKSWVTYFLDNDDTSDDSLELHAEDALTDDRDGEGSADVTVDHLREVELSDEKSAERWLRVLEQDGWADSIPFLTGTVQDGVDDERTCRQIIKDYIEFIRKARCAEEEARRNEEIDARQTNLPLLND